MIKPLFQHLWSMLRYRRRYFEVMLRNRQISQLRRQINARQDHAIRCLPRHHRFRFENCAAQMGPERSFEAMIADLQATASQMGVSQ